MGWRLAVAIVVILFLWMETRNVSPTFVFVLAQIMKSSNIVTVLLITLMNDCKSIKFIASNQELRLAFFFSWIKFGAFQ